MMRRRKLVTCVASITALCLVVLFVLLCLSFPDGPLPLREGMHKDEVDAKLGKPVEGISLGRPLAAGDGEVVWVYHQGPPYAGRRIRVTCDGNDCVISWTIRREAGNPYWLYEKVKDAIK